MDFFNCYSLGVDHAGNHFRLACSDAKHLPKSKKIQERFLKNKGAQIQEQSFFYLVLFNKDGNLIDKIRLIRVNPAHINSQYQESSSYATSAFEITLANPNSKSISLTVVTTPSKK